MSTGAGSNRTGRLIARIVGLCVAVSWLTVGLGGALGVAAFLYDRAHFAMTTDTSALFSNDLPWRKNAAALDAAFPHHGSDVVAVIDGRTPELADDAFQRLTEALKAEPKLFKSVNAAEGDGFFEREGLLYLSTDEVKSNTASLIKAEPLLGPMASDPSLRGLMGALSTAALGVKTGQASFADMDPAMRSLTTAVDASVAGRPAFFSWRALTGGAVKPRELRRIVTVEPALNYAQLEPGRGATDVIRAAAARLKLDADHGVRVRLTGDVPLEDDEFHTLTEHALEIGLSMGAFIILMLWLATRSVRVILCILATTVLGLLVSAAIGLMAFQRFNVISVGFFPLFVGLGIDFGIQFSVRFRAEQLTHDAPAPALRAAALEVGRSLLIAAVAIALGFLAFLPTSYAGVAELGLIAGVGMLVAVALNLTVLPALLRIARPRPQASVRAGFDFTAPLDRFVIERRWWVLGVAGAACVGSLCLLPFLHFDFNPLHLRSAKVESVSTVLDLMKDPDLSPNTIDVVKPTLAAADAEAKRLETLPEVAHATTLSSLVPTDQPTKLAVIQDASTLLDLALNPLTVQPAPADAESVAALTKTSADLAAAAEGKADAPAQDARALSSALTRLAAASPEARARATSALIHPLNVLLNQVRTSLAATPVTLDTLPPGLKRVWLSPDGQARISVAPKGDSSANPVLIRFAKAVLALDPTATGAPITIQESGRTVSGAFLQAGLLSFIAITALLALVLRRVKDVAVTMTPVVITGLLTLGSCVVIGQPLNFANIIALPLLFGIGVAFHIYFVVAWRAGSGHLLNSSLARAVLFSALTTATGFGSLWLSSHPGTASMGKLLMISLFWTLTTALITQPALMGRAPND